MREYQFIHWELHLGKVIFRLLLFYFSLNFFRRLWFGNIRDWWRFWNLLFGVFGSLINHLCQNLEKFWILFWLLFYSFRSNKWVDWRRGLFRNLYYLLFLNLFNLILLSPLINHLFLHNNLFFSILWSIFWIMKLLHSLYIELFELNGLFLSSTCLLVVFVTVHYHFVDVSLKLSHMLILVSSNLVLYSF